MSLLVSTVGQVFMVVAAKPDSAVREIAGHLGVTERTVMRALTELSQAGLISVQRRGRRNRYEVAETGQMTVGPLGFDVGEIVRLARGGSQD